MNEISDFMEADHLRLNASFVDFQKLKISDSKKSKEIFLEFASELKRHILWEEEILFVSIGDKLKIKKGTSAGKSLSMLSMQHTQIIDFLQQIKSELENGINENQFENLLTEILEHHNQVEEGIVYPLIDELLTEEEKKSIFLKMKNLPKEKYSI